MSDPTDPLDDDRNQQDPTEDADWDTIHERMGDDFDDFLDHDHSMDY